MPKYVLEDIIKQNASDFLVTRGGDGYTMFKDAKLLIKAENAPKDSELLENSIRNSAGKTIAPKLENRVVKIGYKN